MGRFYVGITDAEVNLIGNIRTFYPGTGKIFHLIIDLESIEFPTFLQSLGQADGTIATKCAYFQNILRANHLYKHFEKPALNMAASHTSMDSMYIGGAVKTIQIIAFRLYMLADIFVYEFSLSHNLMDLE